MCEDGFFIKAIVYSHVPVQPFIAAKEVFIPRAIPVRPAQGDLLCCRNTPLRSETLLIQ